MTRAMLPVIQVSLNPEIIMSDPKPIINCHTHIFTGEHVPPQIGKTYIPWPFYNILSVPFLLWACRLWYMHPNSPKKWKYKIWYIRSQKIIYGWRSFVKRHLLTNLFISLLNAVIVYHALVYFFQWLNSLFFKPEEKTGNVIQKIINWLLDYHLLYMPPSGWIKALVILFVLFCIAYGRKLIFFMLKKLWSFLSILPDKKTLQFLSRYINIGRFAYYKDQSRIFLKLRNQYQPGTGFVILPMDMEFMAAGKLKVEGRYENQMEQLAELKNSKNNGEHVFPFVFIDPRRERAGGKDFIKWIQSGEKVILEDCFVKDYIEEKKFNGFKIYPALGYYPFDTRLLPLWKYAADNQIPILTHCIRGTIFYRGRKEKDWGFHPIFKQANGEKVLGKLLLPQLKNQDFINNFTHPLNYLCLVEEKLLRLVVKNADEKTKKLFGYNGMEKPMNNDLRHLKLCFGHYGGEEEWKKYFEKDRDDFTSQLITEPGRGIAFIKDGEDYDDSFRRLEKLWKWVDWYSIISSLMLQYDNLYADISYIIHDEAIVPLLKEALQNNELKERILFGTDFYVVRNHKSEKEMLAEIISCLSETEFDMIARRNPATFLKRL